MLSTTVNVSDKNSNSIQSSISGVSGDDNQLSYGVSLNTQENGPTGYAVNGSYRSPVATLQATAGNDSRHNRQISAGISGAIVAHPFGVTASNDLGDTFTVIHADGAGGAVINNAPGNRLDPGVTALFRMSHLTKRIISVSTRQRWLRMWNCLQQSGKLFPGPTVPPW